MDDNVFAVKGEKRTLYFEKYSTADGSGTRIVRCAPKNGFCVFEIGAHYNKSKPPCLYYRLAKSLRRAKAEFEASSPWLDICFIRKITDADELQKILSDPMRIPI